MECHQCSVQRLLPFLISVAGLTVAVAALPWQQLLSVPGCSGLHRSVINQRQRSMERSRFHVCSSQGEDLHDKLRLTGQFDTAPKVLNTVLHQRYVQPCLFLLLAHLYDRSVVFEGSLQAHIPVGARAHHQLTRRCRNHQQEYSRQAVGHYKPHILYITIHSYQLHCTAMLEHPGDILRRTHGPGDMLSRTLFYRCHSRIQMQQLVTNRL